MLALPLGLLLRALLRLRLLPVLLRPLSIGDLDLSRCRSEDDDEEDEEDDDEEDEENEDKEDSRDEDEKEGTTPRGPPNVNGPLIML